MKQAKHGDTVRVHYRGKLPDGSIFDETFGRAPLRFTIGEGQLIPGFEEAVVGMSPGDSKTAELSSDNAFGPYQKDLVAELPKSSFNDLEVKLVVGERVPIPHPDGPPIPIEVAVTEVTASTVTVDANHPLAGENLSFEIELLDIVQGPH